MLQISGHGRHSDTLQLNRNFIDRADTSADAQCQINLITGATAHLKTVVSRDIRSGREAGVDLNGKAEFGNIDIAGLPTGRRRAYGQGVGRAASGQICHGKNIAARIKINGY